MILAMICHPCQAYACLAQLPDAAAARICDFLGRNTSTAHLAAVRGVTNLQGTSVGRPIMRKEAYDKVTGVAKYTGDMTFRSLLHARTVSSPHAHARIVSIDTSEAMKVPGVKAILTGETFPVYTGSVIADRPPLAMGKVRYFGEPVALVVADTEYHARLAGTRIKIIYEPLPVVDSIETAIAEDAPLVHEDLARYDRVMAEVKPVRGTNIADQWKIRKGDLARGWAASEVKVETKVSLPHSDHVAMETRNSRCEIHPDGTVIIDTATQAPFSVKKAICSFFNVDFGRIVVRTPFVGGAFGGKAGPQTEFLTYLASYAVGGRPVEYTASREEDLITWPTHLAMEGTVKLGASRDGRLQATEILFYVDTGAYTDTGPRMTSAMAASCTGPYRIDNVKCDAFCVYTNSPYATSYRGFGHLECMFAVERTMDKLACALGMDPLELRLRNALAPGDTGPTGVRFNSSNLGDLGACLRRIRELASWDDGIRVDTGDKVRAKSVACFWKTSSSPTDAASGALLTFNPDGSINLNCGAVEIGPGQKTTMAQILAERFKIGIDKVHVFMGVDTRITPKHWKTVASMTTFMAGNAVLEAAEDAIRQIRGLAAIILRCPTENVEVSGGRACLMDDPTVGIDLQSIVHGYQFSNGNAIAGQIMGQGTYIMRHLTPLDPETGQGQAGPSWTVGAQVVEVEFSKKDFTFTIPSAVTVLDAGKIINPKTAGGVVMGGMSMGVSLATREHFVFGKGQVVEDTSLRTYKLIRIGEQPYYVVDFVETPQIDGPYGARGLGEHGILGIPAAIAGALSAAAEVEIDTLPVSPEVLWRLKGGDQR